MKNKLYVICAFNEVDAERMGEMLSEIYIKPFSFSIITENIFSIQKNKLNQANLNVERGFLKGWDNEIMNDFIKEIKPFLLKSFDDFSDHYYLYTPLNVFFMETFRKLARRLDIEVVFLVSWHFLKADKKSTPYVFNGLLNLLESSMEDTYYFYSRDIEDNAETSLLWLKHVLNIENIYSRYKPTSLIKTTASLQNDNFDEMDTLPYEIKLLNDILKKKRFGAQVSASELEKIEILRPLVGTNAAIYIWLEQFKDLSKEEYEDNLKYLYINQLQTKENELKTVFRVQYQKYRADNLVFKSRLEELESQRQQIKKKPQAVKKQKTRIAPKANEVKDELTAFERKLNKLKRDPYSFLNDSKSPLVRSLRFFVGKNKK